MRILLVSFACSFTTVISRRWRLTTIPITASTTNTIKNSNINYNVKVCIANGFKGR